MIKILKFSNNHLIDVFYNSYMECECCYEIKAGIKSAYNHFICIDF